MCGARTSSKPGQTRNIASLGALAPDQVLRSPVPRRLAEIVSDSQFNEVTMATTRDYDHDRIVETSTQARQAEPGPSVLALLSASTGLAILILGVIWFAFFRV
jgi:hypothetical protein